MDSGVRVPRVLSNHEVVEVVQLHRRLHEGSRKSMPRLKYKELMWLFSEVEKLTEASGEQTFENVQLFIKQVKAEFEYANLTNLEIVQMINLKPNSSIAIHNVSFGWYCGIVSMTSPGVYQCR
mmetsp:Transcript_830/g.1611  ORF Transcript_830/g.1611 Transcript_830/m.1611 type:complete len:123 (-) Transcript_830:375-743(-)